MVLEPSWSGEKFETNFENVKKLAEASWALPSPTNDQSEDFLSKKDFFPLLLPAHKVFFPTQDHPKVSEKIVNVAKNSFLIASKKKNFWSKFWKELKRSPGHPGQLTFEWQIIIKLSMLQIKLGIWLFMKPYLSRAI